MAYSAVGERSIFADGGWRWAFTKGGVNGMIGVSFTCWPTRSVRQSVPREVSHNYWRLSRISEGRKSMVEVQLALKALD